MMRLFLFLFLSALPASGAAISGLVLTNEFIEVVVDSSRGSFSVLDRRTGSTWHSGTNEASRIAVGATEHLERTVRINGRAVRPGLEIQAEFALASNRPELIVTIRGRGAMSQVLPYPAPLASPAEGYLVIPMNEGMLSLGPYRVPDSGRQMQKIWTEVPEKVARFQVGEKYRLPLWELVYHDCVVSQWYWGDYNNKLPLIWAKRDLFNILYGTPPMFMFSRALWENEKERFVRSYQAIGPVARATAYAEMVEHRFLTPDRAVQKTVFSNGVEVIVNFSSEPFSLGNGAAVPPMSFQSNLNASPKTAGASL